MTDDCELCGKSIRKSHKLVEEIMVIDDKAVTFEFHYACKKGIDWYLELKELCRKNKRTKKPLKSQKKLSEDENDG